MELKYHMDEVGVNTEGFKSGDFPVVVSFEEQYGIGHKSGNLLVTSIVGDVGLTLKMILKKMRKSYDDILMLVDFERNPEKNKRFEVIQINFVIKSNNVEEDIKEELLETIYSESPIIQSVCNNIDIKLTMEIQSGNEA
ncbi:OsmC family protein [Oceanobacillus neutriphilus]|uniref:OsmC-like protein n=1 Tax=Oceanobacillus neutriphilus TaxID=531815 RepID=A0ABQ2P1K7_9BACI|nr:OsmC family protein [Oceanobacillus neutriphilus]GGP15833.1 hypothetical protein GCM10011346_45350 [Oceanobacillus neutriphilus]